MKRKKIDLFSRSAFSFIFLIGIVSLFSDLTHEGATSILGPYLHTLGVSAAGIGFISGFGELIGHSLRLATGYITDKTRRYWPLTIFGYCLDLFSIPLLALVPKGDYKWVFILLIFQKIGKAIKKPAKDTILSFAATQEGVGRSFAIQEALDQLGAFLGPIFVFLILKSRNSNPLTDLDYKVAFLFLGIPALITVLLLIFSKLTFPNPENFEPEVLNNKANGSIITKQILLYLIGIAFFAAGFMDYSLISMHISKSLHDFSELLPLVYSIAMAVDAFAALFFGRYFDKKGLNSVIIATICSAAFAIPIFLSTKLSLQMVGIFLWGIGMGTQESVMKAIVSKYVAKKNRSLGFGIFQTVFGIAWFLGSWLMGSLYDNHRMTMVLFSVSTQILAIIFFTLSKKEAA